MEKKHRLIDKKWHTDNKATATLLKRKLNQYCLEEQPNAILFHQ